MSARDWATAVFVLLLFFGFLALYVWCCGGNLIGPVG
jgi:hypothetical protein